MLKARLRWMLGKCPIAGLLINAASALFFGLLSDLSTAASPPPVSPNQDFSNRMFQLHAPASAGWYGAAQSSSLIEFAKTGATSDESFVAAVQMLHLPKFENADAFTEYVREGVVKGSPSDRFKVIEQNVQLSSDRNYPCVRYHGITNDLKARTSSLFLKKLRFEIIALYCEYPAEPGLGFMISFSHRGGKLGESIEDDAASFLNSVQVTSPGDKP